MKNFVLNLRCDQCPEERKLADRVAKLNDKFRREVLSQGTSDKGKCLLTPGVQALDKGYLVIICADICNFGMHKEHEDQDVWDSESEDTNDPYATHDFGCLSLSDPKIFWKIDYYEDATMEYGTRDMINAYRVLTIMLASEY